MRRICAIKVFVCLIGFTSTAAAETYPYVAYINSDQVRVRCDPSRDQLPTGSLSRGTKVEVYQESPAGWLAIRPPKESFSWIPARHLTMTAGDGIAEVTSDEVQVWVGTMIGQARLISQVRLKAGELVEVLTSHRLTSTSGTSAETWYKISPPAGEFRWIYGKYAQRQKPLDKPRNLTPAEDESGLRYSEQKGSETLMVGWTSRRDKK